MLAGVWSLAGLALLARVACNRTAFDEALLITHGRLSGPASLQISSYQNEGDSIAISRPAPMR